MEDKYVYKTPATEVNDAYLIATDGGMIYDPLSREAAKNGTLNKYDNAEKTATGKLSLSGGQTLSYSVPTEITAYDMIPVKYTIEYPAEKSSEILHVEAVTGEELSRKNQNSFYDCTLPGIVRADFEYLGYTTATDNVENRGIHTGGFVRDIKADKYPQYDIEDFKEYSQVKRSDYVWFRFKYTNTGNTILDSNGSGTFNIEIFLDKKNSAGEYELYLIPHNMFFRTIDDLYPGESNVFDVNFTFDHDNLGSNPHLPVGDYRIRIVTEIRNETDHPENYLINIWGGRPYGTSVYEFSVVDEVTDFTKNKVVNNFNDGFTRNTWLHKFEEFMTSFDSFLNPSVYKSGSEHTMYVQAAPWTETVTLKFMSGNNDDIQTAEIPVTVDTDSVKVDINTDALNYVIQKDGTRWPAVASQSMCDMRLNDCQGPDADVILLNSLLDMKECGVNIVTTTATYEYDINRFDDVNNQADANWFMSDCLRELGMKMEGYITYPYDGQVNIIRARLISHDRVMFPNGKIAKSVADPLLAHANGIKTKYQYLRWGDNYFVSGDGTVPLTTEDSRGWMRVDISNRYILSDEEKNDFRIYLAEKYETIDALNAVWETDYSAFEQIDPMEGSTNDHGNFNLTKKRGKLAEWSTGINELDVFRTRQRTNNYKTVMSYVDGLVNAVMSIRTEGGNFTAVVPFDTPNQHYRHTYYSQRRCALIPQILASESNVKIHSDYITMPYTDSEVTELTKSSVSLGITPMHLPQFDRMRDIAVNSKYGQDYSGEYNLCGENTMGVYINTVRSLFTWFKSIYEAGGIPGILWEDYLCDGFATSVQRKEMKFFAEKIKESMQTQKAIQWANSETVDAKKTVSTSLGKYTFDPGYIKSEIKKTLAGRK